MDLLTVGVVSFVIALIAGALGWRLGPTGASGRIARIAKVSFWVFLGLSAVTNVVAFLSGSQLTWPA